MTALFADAARALEPFAELAEQMFSSRDSEAIFGRINNNGAFRITVGDLREARETFLRLRQVAE